MKERGARARSPGWLGQKAGRRTILGGLGAAALTSASTVFGSQQAEAASPACCHLVFDPSNYATCMDGRHYAWSCQWTSGRHCVCCERMRANGSYFASAYKCSA